MRKIITTRNHIRTFSTITFSYTYITTHTQSQVTSYFVCSSKSLNNTSLLHSDLLSQYNFIDVLTCCFPPFRVKSRAVDVLPSLPALPTAWIYMYISTSSQAPKCMMFLMSWMSTPIPNAMVVITTWRGDTVEKFLIMQFLMHGSVQLWNMSTIKLRHKSCESWGTSEVIS